jgi:hypothetical protein
MDLAFDDMYDMLVFLKPNLRTEPFFKFFWMLQWFYIAKMYFLRLIRVRWQGPIPEEIYQTLLTNKKKGNLN